MRYIVCYDIADDRRRSQMAGVLLDFGRRIQESVFFASLDAALAERMRERLRGIVDECEDRLHIFPVCEACAGRAEAFGRGDIPEDEEHYIV